MVSRYWSFYPAEEPIADASVFLETLTKAQLTSLFAIWCLLYILLSKYILQITYFVASGYLTFQLYLQQNLIMSRLKIKIS